MDDMVKEKATGLSPEAEGALFSRKRVAKAEVASAEDATSVKPPEAGPSEPNLVIHSPAHLWGLGSIEIRLKVRDFGEAAAMVGRAQDFFRNLEKGYADRLEEVQSIQNRITPGQLETLENLAEQLREDLPEGVERFSKTQASNLIREMMQEAGQEEKDDRPQRRGGGAPRSGGRSESRYGNSRRGGGNDGQASDAQVKFIQDICAELDLDEPDGLEDFTAQDAKGFIEDHKDDFYKSKNRGGGRGGNRGYNRRR